MVLKQFIEIKKKKNVRFQIEKCTVLKKQTTKLVYLQEDAGRLSKCIDSI